MSNTPQPGDRVVWHSPSGPKKGTLIKKHRYTEAGTIYKIDFDDIGWDMVLAINVEKAT